MPKHTDGTTVSNSDAVAAWRPIARDLLITTAREYHAHTTYKVLADQVQVRSGIFTNQQLNYWIGALLEQVALEAADLGEPPITSLCVRQDGTIGEGYQTAPRSLPTDGSLNADDQSAEDRLLCYRAYALDLPADGGAPLLTPQVAERRSRQKRVANVSRLQEMTCPSCFLLVPSGPTCSSCGNPLPG